MQVDLTEVGSIKITQSCGKLVQKYQFSVEKYRNSAQKSVKKYVKNLFKKVVQKPKLGISQITFSSINVEKWYFPQVIHKTINKFLHAILFKFLSVKYKFYTFST